jgi:hypothetical protein
MLFTIVAIFLIIGAFRISSRIGSWVLCFFLLAFIVWAWNGTSMWYSRTFGARSHIQASFTVRHGDNSYNGTEGFYVHVRNDSNKAIQGLHVSCGEWSSEAPDIAPHTSYSGFLPWGGTDSTNYCWLDYETVAYHGSTSQHPGGDADSRAVDNSALNNPPPKTEE